MSGRLDRTVIRPEPTHIFLGLPNAWKVKVGKSPVRENGLDDWVRTMEIRPPGLVVDRCLT